MATLIDGRALARKNNQALKAKVPLLPLVTYRNTGRGALFVSEIGRPLELQRSSKLRDALEQGADLVADRLERELTLHPGDWHFWDEFQPGRFLREDGA